jgi:tetratricopeptide (TPR) repeat protein
MRISTVFGLLALAIMLFICLLASPAQENAKSSQAVSSKREASLIEKTGLLEFAVGTNKKALSPAEKALADEMTSVYKLAGDGSNAEEAKKAISELTKVIAAHPQYPDAYFLRATLSISIGARDYQNMLADINRAIQLKTEGQLSSYDSATTMYACRGKVQLLSGHPSDCINDLEKAVTTDVWNADDVLATGSLKPEDKSNPAVPQKTDYDALVARFPEDYRVYMLRGLFYGTFSGEHYSDSASEDMKKAAQLNAKSALVKYFQGLIANKTAYLAEAIAQNPLSGASPSSDLKAQAYKNALSYFKTALDLDPNFAAASLQIAEYLFERKRYTDAIPYYDKVILLQPKNAIAYNKRGLSKTLTGNYREAIIDISKAIDLKTMNSIESSYQNRADAYLKLGEFDKAIADHSMTIGLSLRNLIFLMSVAQIRSMFPEFSQISDPDLLEGLRQKYFPGMTPADFKSNYAKIEKPYKGFNLAGIYEKRADAYLAAGQFRKAAADYSRERYACEGWVVARWRSFKKTTTSEFQLDTETLDFQNNINPTVWVKEFNLKGGGYTQQNFECDCVNRKLTLVSAISYDSYGNMRNTSSERNAQPIAPQTVGELLFRGLCK